MTAYWKMEEKGGHIVLDSVGAHHAVLMGNASFVNDSQRGCVLSCDGVAGTHALTPSNPVNAAKGTILGWGKLSQAGLTGPRHVFPGQSVAGGNRIYVQVRDGQFEIGLGNVAAIGSTGVRCDDEWHQIALTWSQTETDGGTFHAYFDGREVQAGTYQGLATSANWFSLGSNYDPTSVPAQSNHWTGLIDEVGVWNRPLTSDEISSIFKAKRIAPATSNPARLPTPQIVNRYDFETLHPGNLVGQDFWTAPANGSLTISNDVGVNASKVAGEGDGNGLVTRTNNKISAFRQFSGTEKVAVMQFDLTLTSGDTDAGQVFALGCDRNGNAGIDQPNEYGPCFGIRDGYESFNQYQFGFYLQGAGFGHKYGAPVGNLGTMDDWVQLRLEMNFETGKGSLFFRNLTRGQIDFIAVEAVQDVNLGLESGPPPASWDTMILRNDHHGQFDNLIPNLSTSKLVIEPPKRENVGNSGKQTSSLSRGHQILLQRGLQIHAIVDPQAPSAPIPPFDQSHLKQLHFTGVTVYVTDRRWDLSRYLGPAPGIPVCLKLAYGHLNSNEVSYLPNLVALQLNDEQDVSVPAELDAAKEVLANWRQRYPNTIGYLNQAGSGNGTKQLRHYMSFAKPDMLMFDTYPFNGDINGGSPYPFYRDMQKFRQVALEGNDGTGRQPIPYGYCLQALHAEHFNNHVTSGSETRLNQFAGWAFGFTFASAYTYYNANSSFFEDAPGDSKPRQPFFNEFAETNRQSRNLGHALVRLLSTDVGMIMGEFKHGAQAITNTLPEGVPVWKAGAGTNPYLVDAHAENPGKLNHGLRGDLVIGCFKPLQGLEDRYFMVVNGLTAGTGTAKDATQTIRLSFDFKDSGIESLLRLSRETGKEEVVPLIHDGGTRYHLDFSLEGGTGDLFKYHNGNHFNNLFCEENALWNLR